MGKQLIGGLSITSERFPHWQSECPDFDDPNCELTEPREPCIAEQSWDCWCGCNRQEAE